MNLQLAKGLERLIKIMFIASTFDVHLGSTLKGKVECSLYWLAPSIVVNVREEPNYAFYEEE